MKKTILFVLFALFTCSIGAFAQPKPYGKILNRVNVGPAGTNTAGPTFYWKYWVGGTSAWAKTDTTETFLRTNLRPGDTAISYFVTSGATKEYRCAIKIQFGKEGNWRPAFLLDSMARTGGAQTLKTTYDSVVVGRSLWFIINGTGNAACDRWRFLIDKDTTSASGTDESGEKYMMGVNYHQQY